MKTKKISNLVAMPIISIITVHGDRFVPGVLASGDLSVPLFRDDAVARSFQIGIIMIIVNRN